MAQADYQEVTLSLRFADGRSCGTFRVRAHARKPCETIVHEQIVCENVPQVESPTYKNPIEYCTREPLAGLSRVMFLEETDYDVYFIGHGEGAVTMFPKLTGGVYRENLFNKEKNKRAGALNFRSYVGRTWLSVLIDGEECIPIPIEVRSKKLGYADEYVSMMGDLSQDCSALIYSLKSPVHQFFQFSDLQRKTHFEDYLFLEHLFKDQNLPAAYARIREAPKSRLVNYQETVPVGYASRVRPTDLVDMVCDSGNLALAQEAPLGWPEAMKGYVPLEINETKSRETRDIPENRLVKFFLGQVLDLALALIRESESQANKSGMAGIRSRLEYFAEEVSGYLGDEWLIDVGELRTIPMNSQTLQKQGGYREVYRFWQDFDFAFRFHWDALEEDIIAAEKRMHQLYEYWCFFRLVDALREVATQLTPTSSLLQVVTGGWEVKLKAGKSARLKFEHETGEGQVRSVELYYNRGFSPRKTNRGSYSLPFRPDYTVCIHGENGKDRVYCHFDAKYRSQDELKHFDFGKRSTGLVMEESELGLSKQEIGLIEKGKEAERAREFKDGDIYKMHTYKDAIFYSQGAYVLYPGERVGLFRDSVSLDEAEDIPSVGAFPLRPGEVGLKKGSDELVAFLRVVMN